MARADGPAFFTDNCYTGTPVLDDDATRRLVIVDDWTMNAPLLDDHAACRLVIINDRPMATPMPKNDILATSGIHSHAGFRTPADGRVTALGAGP
jgi:hypothetical protein